MADIIEKHGSHAALSDAEAVELIELLFFAYRDFVSDADAILEELGFGRAHHRVLHFVGRDPGMTVAELLDMLKITKQSLSRVLKELIEKDYIEQKEGQEDRRQRLLYLTSRGADLWRKLIAPQMKRFRTALNEGDQAKIKTMLAGLITEDNRETIQSWLARSHVIGPA